MKKISLTIIVFMSFILAVNAQVQKKTFYYYKGEKIELTEVKGKELVLVEANKEVTLRSSLQRANIAIEQMKEITLSNTIKKISTSVSIPNYKWGISTGTSSIRNAYSEAAYTSPFYTLNGKEVGVSHLFYVKLKNQNGVAQLKQLADKHKVTVVGNNQYMPLWYVLMCSKESSGNALELANLFHETGLFAVSEPDIMSDIKANCDNDPHFNDQWGLKNTSQHGGTTGFDINYCNAKQLSTGGNIVAVFDEGVDLYHPDLNLHPLSFDTKTGVSPSIVRGPHGTSCAGIITAKSNNNLGVSGIAPNSQTMSISFVFGYNPNGSMEIADGINFAVANGASVISNSWGGGAQSCLVDEAFNRALTEGRNGLGCVVVFAAGNDDSAINYLARSNPDFIVVGAMSPCGERKNPSSCDGKEYWGSNYGPRLDVIAPGVLIPSTDIVGLGGYDPGDYTMDFGGTSSACPHVAGIASLILSVNPNLTQKEVATIIEKTARKVGGYTYATATDRPNGTWHEEVGYGLVDAYEALKMAKPVETDVTYANVDGVRIIKTSPYEYELRGVKTPGEIYVHWGTVKNCSVLDIYSWHEWENNAPYTVKIFTPTPGETVQILLTTYNPSIPGPKKEYRQLFQFRDSSTPNLRIDAGGKKDVNIGDIIEYKIVNSPDAIDVYTVDWICSDNLTILEKSFSSMKAKAVGHGGGTADVSFSIIHPDAGLNINTQTIRNLDVHVLKDMGKYHEDDKEGLRVFLRQGRNLRGAQLLPRDTANWYTSELWVDKIKSNEVDNRNACTWESGERYNRRLVKLDFSGYYAVDCNFTGKFNGWYFPYLSSLSFREQNLSEVDLEYNYGLISLDLSNMSWGQSAPLRLSLPTRGVESYNYILDELYLSDTYINSLWLDLFWGLRVLECNNSQLELLSLQGTERLEVLKCAGNNFNTFRYQGLYSDNNMLRIFESSGSGISIEALQNLLLGTPNLETFSYYGHTFTNIDLSGNLKLKNLTLSSNKLTTLNLTNNVYLEKINCSYNNLEEIFIPNTGRLRDCDLRGNKFKFSTLPLFLSQNGLVNKLSPQKDITAYCYHQNPDSYYGAFSGAMSEAFINNRQSTYAWSDTRGNLIYGIDEEGPGLFSISGDHLGKTIVCKVTNPTFPGLTLKYNVQVIKVTNRSYSASSDLLNSKVSNVSVYPNPAADIININASSEIQSIRVFDIAGRMVLKSNGTNTLNVANLNSGLHIMKIVFENGEEKSLKFNKE